MSINTGVPAFPTVMIGKPEGGMTLRDWFAGMAMQGLLSGKLINTNTVVIAQDCYAMADAMLKQREASK